MIYIDKKMSNIFFKNNSQIRHRLLFTNRLKKFIICESSKAKTISQLIFCFMVVRSDYYVRRND